MLTLKANTKAFFRIPQVLPFVTYAHKKLTDARLSEMLEAFSEDGNLADLLPVYKRMGSLLVSKHKVEQTAAKASRISYPTIRPLTTSTEPPQKRLSPEVIAAVVRFISISSHIEDSDHHAHEKSADKEETRKVHAISRM